MKRNVFGAIIVAGGLALWTSVAGFADFTPATAKAAIATCAATVVLTDPAKDARAINAQLTEIVDETCQSIANLKAEYAAAIAELKAGSTQPNVEKQDGNQQEVDKADKPEVEHADKAEKPEVRSTSREGND
jgi:hypothetical protein